MPKGIMGNAGQRLFWLKLEAFYREKASVFKFLRLRERFRNVPSTRRLSVDGRPNRKNNAAFSNFSVSVDEAQPRSQSPLNLK